MQFYKNMKKNLFPILMVLFSLLTIHPISAQTSVNNKTGQLSWSDPAAKEISISDNNFGLTEEPGIIHAKPFISDFAEKSPFPERYDARELGLITSVKNQKPYDLCWAESVMSMAESNLIKKGLADKDIDLSEVFAHYFQWFRQPDPLGLTANDKNIWRAYESYPGYIREWINSWGSGYRAVLLFSGWPGLASENTAPYPDENADITNYSLDPNLAWSSSVAGLKDASWISMLDTQAIKRLIMKRGSAVFAFYQNREKYLNPETAAYYDPIFNYTNHLVNVVGWDDTYPGERFLEKPPVDGAWLVKNSFGTEWGDQGYFWLSYADKSISADAFFFDFEAIAPDRRTYQYDGTVSYNYLNDPESQIITAANIFTAIDNEKLTSVGFVTPSSYFSYKIEIFRGVKDTPDSGILFLKQTGNELYAGFHTIDLENPVDLVSGDRFSVIIEITANSIGNAFIMTDRSESYTVKDADEKEVTYQEFVSSSNPGESFYKTRYGQWIDCWDEDPSASLGNVRIKAFTKPVSYTAVKSADPVHRQYTAPILYPMDWNDNPRPLPHF